MQFNKNWTIALALSVAFFVVYLLTMVPGLYYTDSGELAAAASVWGVAHPTGYPFYTLVGHFLTLVSPLQPIVTMNTFAAACCAAAIGFFYVFAYNVIATMYSGLSTGVVRAVAGASAALLGASASVWGQATSAEVYSLNFLLLCATLLTVERSTVNTERFYQLSALSGLLFGLMLANHLSSAFLAPGLLLLWNNGAPIKTRKPHLKWIVGPAILAVLLYALLPMRSSTLPPMNWGWVHRDFSTFWYHIRGTQFAVWLFSDPKVLRVNANLFASLQAQSLLWIGLAAAATGMITAFKNRTSMAGGLVLLALGNLGISLGYGIPDIESYFVPAIVISMMFTAIGCATLVKKAKPTYAYGLLLFPLVAISLNFSTMDKSKHTVVPDYVEWTLENADQNALIFTKQWDYLCSAFWYKQVVEGYRSDVVMIDKELLRRTWYIPHLQHHYPDVMKKVETEADAYLAYLNMFEADSDEFMEDGRNAQVIQQRFVTLLNAIVAANVHRPTYITPELLSDEKGFAEGYSIYPQGPLYKVEPKVTSTSKIRTKHLEQLASSARFAKDRLDSGIQEMTISAIVSSAMYELEGRSDTAAFRSLRATAININNRSRSVRVISELLP